MFYSFSYFGFNPTKRILRLFQESISRASIAAISVAAHEVGHAIQYANGYIQLTLSNMFFSIARFEYSAAWLFIMIGLLIPKLGGFMNIGILLFGAAALTYIAATTSGIAQFLKPILIRNSQE